MSVPAATVLQNAITIIQDSTNVRWPLPEMVGWLNAGQREIVMSRPDANVVIGPIPLVAGTKQTVPAGGFKLLDIVRNSSTNVGGTQRPVRLVQREILDAQLPGWHSMPPAIDVVHYTFDDRDPSVFYTYPPATAGNNVDGIYSAYPTDVPIPAAGAALSTVTQNISVLDTFANALTDYILYRAYSKDAQYAGNGQRAMAHFQAFANALGIELKGTQQMGPTLSGSVFNPNTPNPTPAPGAQMQ